MAVIWHLALTSDWDQARDEGSYTISTLGMSLPQVGFIHCSSTHQVAGVVARFYASVSAPLTLLGIDTQRLGDAGIEVRMEPGDPAHPDDERFPHVYGAIPLDAVTETHPARVADGRLDAPTWRV